MKLTTLAINGIKHNIRNYIMYFVAMCFCVFTTYTFSALTLSDSVSTKLGTSNNYKVTFIAFGIIILVFVFFFLISSNKSFIRYRKREISTYALFGMSNSKLAWLLFLDTLIIGFAALIVGILVGIFFSKLMVMLLLKMVMADFSGSIQFTIDPIAIAITLGVFLLTFLVMGLSGRRIISKFQLVDLFKGEKVSEGKTRGSMALLILSVILIALGYIGALQQNPQTVFMLMIFVIIVVVIGTYLFFSGGLQKVLTLMKKNKRKLYKKNRLIPVSLFSHKVKTMAGTMGTIAVLVAVATTAIAFGYTLYQTAEGNTYENCSFDVRYSTGDEALTAEVKQVLVAHNLDITEEIKQDRYVSTPTAENIPNDIAFFFEDSKKINTYSESMYNEIAGLSKDSNPELQVEKGKAYVVYPNYIDIGKTYKFNLDFSGNQIEAESKNLPNTYTFGGWLMTMVLDDSDFAALVEKGEITVNDDAHKSTFVGLNYKNALSSGEAAKDLEEVIASRAGSYNIAYNHYIDQMSLYGLLCFIGYFICAVFIIMSASMLYFKQIVIGTEERRQYMMMRKIGMSAEEEKKVVRGRLIPVFFLPLIMGIMHSLFAMKAADTIIFSNMMYASGATFGKVLLASLVMYAVYTLVYTFFYLITKSQYRKTIR